MSNQDLPQGWVASQLLQVCSVRTGKVDANHADDIGDYDFFTCALEPLKAKTFSFDGELIILPGNGANVGHVAFYEGKIEAYQRTYILNSFFIEAKYIYYHLKLYWKSINKDKQFGSATNYIKLGNFQTYQLSIAPLAEQKEIVRVVESHLKLVDQIKSRLDALPKILEQFRQSVLASAVSGKLTEDWRKISLQQTLFNQELQALKIFKTKPLAELPKKWCWLNFSDVADIASNLEDPSLEPTAIHVAPNHIESKTGRILYLSTIEADAVISAKHRFYQGQILYSKIRPNLCKVVVAKFSGLCSADMYPINAKINTNYLYIWMLSPLFTYWAASAESRVVLPKINQKTLNLIPVPTPSLEEQQEIVERVENLFALADQIEEKIKNAQERVNLLTQSILAKAFRGELTTKWREENPDLISGENSAEALLKRIEEEKKTNKKK